MAEVEQMRAYVRDLDIKGTKRPIVEQGPGDDAEKVFDQAKNQAQVVGSGVFSFATGVTPQVREAISDTALLAQLVANKRVDVAADPLRWFREYGDVLQNLGWTLQEGSWDDYSTGGTAVEVHEKIVEIMTALLGPGATALKIITTTVAALKGMKSDSSWITIFSRETQKAKLARFQVGLVTTEPTGEVFVHLLMTYIQAKKSITQVLVFKYKEDKAKFQASSGKISINRTALEGVLPAVRAKIAAYQASYLSSIKDLDL